MRTLAVPHCVAVWVSRYKALLWVVCRRLEPNLGQLLLFFRQSVEGVNPNRGWAKWKNASSVFLHGS